MSTSRRPRSDHERPEPTGRLVRPPAVQRQDLGPDVLGWDDEPIPPWIRSTYLAADTLARALHREMQGTGPHECNPACRRAFCRWTHVRDAWEAVQHAQAGLWQVKCREDLADL